jgi:alanine racemase
MNIFSKVLSRLGSWTSPRFEPLVTLRIFSSAVLGNLRTFRAAYPQVKIAPVLKSNAYGHGLSQVAQILQTETLPFVCIDSLFEAESLYRSGFKKPLLVLGFSRTESIVGCRLPCAFSVGSLEQLDELAKKAKRPIKVHLKLDTGMHRQGILPSQVQAASRSLQQNPHLKLAGIFSHLAAAGLQAHNFRTQQQIDVWNSLVRYFKQDFPRLEYWHLAATSGFPSLTKIDSNSARLGLGLYGLKPFVDFPLALQPALEMTTLVASVKSLSAQSAVGYDFTFESSDDIKLALVPVGYFEGIDRRLSGKGQMKIGSHFVPIVGRVSMNMVTLDITNLSPVGYKDIVTVISRDSQDLNSVENWAKVCETIPYEILVHIPQHLKRVVI